MAVRLSNKEAAEFERRGIIPKAAVKRERRPDGFRSKLEAKFAAEVAAGCLSVDNLAGGRLANDYMYEAVKLRLADRTYYTPDFLVTTLSGERWLIEVKGSWSAPHQAKSRVKLKVAAEQFRGVFRFAAATYDRRGGWKFEVMR